MGDLHSLFLSAVRKAVHNEGRPALLGKADETTLYYTGANGTEYKDRVWVRYLDVTDEIIGEVVVNNGGVPPQIGLPVLVVERRGAPFAIPDQYGILANYFSGASGGGGSTVGAHTHQRLGLYPDYVEGLRLRPLLVRSSDPPALTVYVEPGWYRYRGTWDVWEGGDTASLSSYVPAAGTVHWLTVCLDRENNQLAIVDGGDLSASGDSIYDQIAPDVAYSDIEGITIPDAYYPLAVVELENGQTTIGPRSITHDLRLWGQEVPVEFDIDGLTTVTSVDESADYLAIHDTSAGALRKVLVEDFPGGKGNVTLLFSQIVDKTVANTTTETSLLSAGRGSKTLPADTLKQGTVIRITLSGKLSDTGNPTLNIRLKLGGTEVCSTGANNLDTSVTDVDWRTELHFVCRSTGASGTVQGGGYFSHDNGSDFGMVNASTITVDTTAALDIDVTATWGTADAANTITCQEAPIEKLAETGLTLAGPSSLTATETV